MKWNKSHIVLLMNMFVACSEGGSLEDNTLSENIPIELGAYASKYSDTRAGGTIGNNDLAALAQNGGFGVYSYFLKKQEFMINQQVTAVTRDLEGGGKEITGWTYSPMKYWPNNPSSTLDFFAYAPYAKPSVGDDTGIISIHDTNHIPVVTYQLDKYGRNVDLLWGTNGDVAGAKGVFIDINCSYAKFRLSEDALKKAYLLLSSRIYERLGNNKAFRLEDYTGRNYGILDRLYINNKLSAEYCAGQDEESEMKIIKTILRNNV